MNLLYFIGDFYIEVSKMLEVVNSLGEANGLQWVNGVFGKWEVYFLWFPKAKKLLCVVKNGEVEKSWEVVVKDVFEAIAVAERILSRLK
ncbi:MAG: hypothetical protein QXW44_02490 [Pyrobaculum sp.]